MAIGERTRTSYFTRCDICGNEAPGHHPAGWERLEYPAGWERLEWRNGLDLVQIDICPDCHDDSLAEAYRVKAMGTTLFRPATEEEAL